MTFLRRLLYVLRNRRMEAEFAEELETHRLLAQQRELQAGAADAAAASRRVMGNVTLAREDARGWIAPWLDSVWQDGMFAADVPPCAGVHGRVRARDGARRGGDDGCVRTRRRPRAEGFSGERPDRLVYFSAPSFSYPIFSEVKARSTDVLAASPPGALRTRTRRGRSIGAVRGADRIR